MPALLFGSISTVVDTSELQRSAFNQAFSKHGLSWEWGQADYQDLLVDNGGADRVRAYAEKRGESVETSGVHETKSQIFQGSLTTSDLAARPGVVESIAAAREAGWRIGLVTTTSRANVTALLRGLDDLSEDDFDVITDVGTVTHPKPSPEVYVAALDILEETASDCIAIEDNLGGVESATAAGLVCLAFPNENTEGHDFGSVEVVDEISFDQLAAATGGRR